MNIRGLFCKNYEQLSAVVVFLLRSSVVVSGHRTNLIFCNSAVEYSFLSPTVQKHLTSRLLKLTRTEGRARNKYFFATSECMCD